MKLQFPDFVPKARCFGDTVTPKQIGLINALAREKKADAEEEARRHYGCELSECSKEAASRLIDHLKDGSWLALVKDGVQKGVVAEVGPDNVIRPVREDADASGLTGGLCGPAHFCKCAECGYSESVDGAHHPNFARSHKFVPGCGVHSTEEG